jgi:DNA mismatch repair protein MutL
LIESSPIRRLDEGVVASIAAGEVVERPASAVKELVENSLDAGATRVDVSYEDRGATRIVVTDDGRGIPDGEIGLALERHATSKIRTLADVAAARTFGFRGEALASIASASELEIETAVAEASAGTLVRVAAGRVTERAPSNMQRGTRIDVTDLFAAVPARRKFLKSPATESSAVADVVRRFALARPDVRFCLRHNGRNTFVVAPVGDLKSRAAQVLGPDDSLGLLPVEATLGGLSLTGLVSPPGRAYGSGRRMSIFVGHRWVRDQVLFRAVLEGYDTHLLKGRFPACVLFLSVEDGEVDVNVHPSKLEVRFSNSDAVRRFVSESVRDALRHGASPLGRWGIDADETLRRTAAARPSLQARPVPDGVDRATQRTNATAMPDTSLRGYTDGEVAAGYVGSDHTVSESSDATEALAGYERASDGESRSPVGGDQTAMSWGAGDRPGLLGRLAVLGQVFGGYIVAEADEELVLVDQHAAHECMLFARLMEAWEQGAVSRQGVLLSIPIHVGSAAVDACERGREELDRVGWEIDVFGTEDVVVRSIPAIAAGGDLTAMTEAVLADLLELGAAVSARRFAERVLATVACHSAVRVGKRLDARAARALLAELSMVAMRSSCPHGRPVARSLARSKVEGLFGR